MKKKMIFSVVGLTFVLLLGFTLSVQAVPINVASDIMYDNGNWSPASDFLSGTVAGIAPTAGTDTMHFSSNDASTLGPNFITFAGTLLAAGDYTATIDAGNYNNFPFATIGNIGMTAGGTLLTSTSTNTPIPGSGLIEEWTFSYTIELSNSFLGQNIGFSITVPFNVTPSNSSFDNLNIYFEAATVPEPTTIALLGIGMVGLAGGVIRRRLKKKSPVDSRN